MHPTRSVPKPRGPLNEPRTHGRGIAHSALTSCSLRRAFAPWTVRRLIASQTSVSGTPATADDAHAPKFAYPYNDGDGKRHKATIEHIFPALEQQLQQPEQQQQGQQQQHRQGQQLQEEHHKQQQQQQHQAASASASGRPMAPWKMGWQMNERNVLWNDDLKLRLIKRIASDELGLSDEALEERLTQLGALLPGLEARLGKAPPKLLARLAADTGAVAQRLLLLKGLFPQANLSAMVNNRLSLLLDNDTAQLAAAATRLRELLPGINVDRFVELHPLVLDVECFEMALEDARRLMPGVDVTAMLRSNPDVILSLVKGKNLIPYDQISNPWA